MIFKKNITQEDMDKFNKKIDSLISFLTNIKKQVNDNYNSKRFILLGCKGDLILFNVESDRFVKSYWDLGYLDEKEVEKQ